ncbi:MAG: hypothetical protein LBC13_03930 [Clostridiales bacterium]|jgi:hypothetical protein|nr:hypothetical protein [Clostridiales bacterium]
MTDIIKSQKLIIMILGRKAENEAVHILNKSGINFHLAVLGTGTAPSEAMSYFGFGETEKSLIFIVVSEDKVKDIFDLAETELHLSESNTGIAFSVPVVSISNRAVLEFLNSSAN